MTDIEKIHKIDLELARDVVALCEKHNLTYYMLGGTMLGAIRHRGFIPWDDDIDFGMPRRDYEKFLNLAEELPERIKVINYRNTPEYQYYITRVVDTETHVIEERIGNENKHTHVSIDIFPIDGTPNNKILRKLYFFRVLFHRAMMSLCYKDSIDWKRKRGPAERLLLGILMRIPVERFTTPQKEKEKIDRLLRSQDVETSTYIGNIMGAYRTREIVPKAWYGKGKMYRFEDMEFRGFEQADAYLTYTFGNYMLLPPADARKTHYILEESADE